jgi:hypothetical protein
MQDFPFRENALALMRPLSSKEIYYSYKTLIPLILRSYIKIY